MSTRAQRAAALLWSLALLFFARPGEAAPEAPLTLRQASAALIVEGRTLRPREIELPLHWDAVFKGWSGSADLTLRFDYGRTVPWVRSEDHGRLGRTCATSRTSSTRPPARSS